MNIHTYFGHRIVLSCCLMAISILIDAQQTTNTLSDATMNYIVEVTPTTNCNNVSIATDLYTGNGVTFTANANTAGDGIVVYHYLNGRGLPVQESVIKAVAGTTNRSTKISYDALGRATRTWFPVITSNTGGYVEDYESHISVQSSYPYVETSWEQSPLSRQLQEKQMDIYHGHPSTISYETNAANEVKHFAVGNAQVQCTGYYAAGALSKKRLSDPDNMQVIEYKDALDRLIMRCVGTNACTYYVYNDQNQLVYVIPPLLADQISIGSSCADSDNDMQRYAYLYQYDKRGNIAQKRLPGCDPVYYVYDRAKRMIYSQDGNQRERGAYWKAYAYDRLGRPAVTMEVEIENTTWAELQTMMENKICMVDFDLSASVGEFGNIGYSMDSIVGVPMKIYTVLYYDAYSFLTLESLGHRVGLAYMNREGYDERNSAQNAAKGLPTGQRVYSLTDDSYTVSVQYYDSRGRVVQQHATNALGGYDNDYYALSFSGQPLKHLNAHSIASTPGLAEEYTFTYDNMDRLVETRYKHGSDDSYLLSRRTYDAFDRLVLKSLFGGLDNIVYSYDICSHLTQIHASSGFDEHLYYGTGDENVCISHCFNGNISGTTWTYGNQTNGYAYQYDNMNRLSFARGIDNGNYWDNHYNVNFSYDKQGNVTHLTRWNNEDIMTDLSLSYLGNQLRQVSDNYLIFGYRDKHYKDLSNNRFVEFLYDKNGNLTRDYDRGISSIEYNSLNLAQNLQFDNGSLIAHEYDALGRRLQSTYTTLRQPLAEPATNALIGSIGLFPFVITTTYAYVGNKRYVQTGNGAWRLDFVFTPEGYVRYDDNGGHSTYYYVKDHLGSVRETFVKTGPSSKELVQRMQYYPSGLPWGECTGASVQPYKYASKEYIEVGDLDEYDSEARWYYPTIMRTTTMDPLCEKYYSISPYAWCNNNPVRFVDPDGRDTMNYCLSTGRFEFRPGGEQYVLQIVSSTGVKGTMTLENGSFSEVREAQKEFTSKKNGTHTETISYFVLTSKDYEKVMAFLCLNGSHKEIGILSKQVDGQVISYVGGSGLDHACGLSTYIRSIDPGPFFEDAHFHPGGSDVPSGLEDGTWGDIATKRRNGDQSTCKYYIYTYLGLMYDGWTKSDYTDK